MEGFENILKFLRAIEGDPDARWVNAGSVWGELSDCDQGIRNG
jgi:hypothetical protein